jgi:uncharacterized membrane protein (UPF0127 family)
MNQRSGALSGLLAPLATPRGQAWLRAAVWGLLGVSLLGLLLVSADQPANRHLLGPAAVAGTRATPQSSRVPGFNQVGFRLISSAVGGAGRPGCALLADTADQQLRGLMGRHDFAGYDAMLFRFPADTRVSFYNKDVPMPISVAWFDGSGVFVKAGELAVCNAACPLIQPGQAFRYVLEVAKGGLRHLGAVPGSVLLVGGTC